MAVQWEVKQGGHVQINQQLLVVWLHRRRWSAEFSALVTKLESVSSRGIDQERARYQKVEELKETIKNNRRCKNHSRKEYKLIKVSHPRVVLDSSLLRCELLFMSKLYNSRLLCCKVRLHHFVAFTD